MTASRRLAAILAADVVGYSRLMGEDEAGTALSVREHREAARPIVADFSGRIVKTTGDGLLLEFPSVVAAVECAIAIQKLMTERNAGVPEAKRILYRIGVNLGDVLIEGDDVLGDGVNIAARLEGLCEPGGVLISGAAFDHVRGRIDADFADLGEKDLKNIPRPVRVYSVGTGAAVSTLAAHSSAPESPGPPRLSIVVLPFANIGGNVDQEYFVDGVTESLTTDLSRMPGMLVIGRNTAFAYKGKSGDLKQIGRELNIRYVLEGSVQRGGNRMRLNVQLIDAETGNHLWAERFDKPVADLFDMQDEIVARLANSLNTQLITAEARRAERAPRPDSMDLYFQGMAWFNKGLTPECLSRAENYFERALSLDSDNVEALVGIALVNCQYAGTHTSDDLPSRKAASEAFAMRALSLAPDHPLGRTCLGLAYMYSNRAAQGIAQCERALALDRNLAFAHGYIGMAKYFVGRGEETEGHIDEAFRLSPRDTFAYLWRGIAGIAKVFLGQYEEAVPRLRQSIEINRNFSSAHFYLAVAFAELGQLDDARTAVQNGLASNPGFTILRYRSAAPSDNPTFMKARERNYAAMRKAGVPEQ